MRQPSERPAPLPGIVRKSLLSLATVLLLSSASDVDAQPLRITTLAGLAGSPGSADGTANMARFFGPYGAAADGLGNVYVADSYNFAIRRIVVATGQVTTLAGLSGSYGSEDGSGASARFFLPQGVAADGSGNVYVADTMNCTVRMIHVATRAATTVAGMALLPGAADGTGSAAQFAFPTAVAADGNGNLFVADAGNYTIRKIVISTGKVSTLAGLAGSDSHADGIGSAARFTFPTGVAADHSGNVYVADRDSQTIRRIEVATGLVTTIAGTPGSRGSTDGTGSAARFAGPWNVAWDGAGNLFVTDGSTIRKIGLATGAVTTVAGLPGLTGATDGVGSSARFTGPTGVAADGAGNVFVTDVLNHTIRWGTPAPPLADAATIDASTGFVGERRQLDTTPDTATTWLWEVIQRPAGSSASLSSTSTRNPTFIPDKPGTYVFRLTASDASGAQSITTVSLTVTVPTVTLKADFTWTANPTAGQTIQFTDTSTGSPTSWSWDFGDGFTSTSQSPTHLFATAGTFPVSLTVSNNTGSNGTTKTVTVASAGASNCVEDAITMCLAAGRYRVRSHWRNQYAGGALSTLSKAKLTDLTGAFWLTNADTYEYLIRINTATDNGAAWIAIPTFTDVEFWIDVTDTVTGQSKAYHSAPGNKTLIYDPYFFVYP